MNGDRRGIADAAYNFFGVSDLRQLRVEQAALLAALLKSPSTFNPRTHPQAARKRRDLVLFKMRELDHITKQEYQAAVRTEVRVEPNLNRYELLIRAANSTHGVNE
ncbi:MAG: transglycosylase domain-containing protein [Acidobacteria bacterium]|nr:transglycosylase domain-containing protein [Acidobacteriota bacterium]